MHSTRDGALFVATRDGSGKLCGCTLGCERHSIWLVLVPLEVPLGAGGWEVGGRRNTFESSPRDMDVRSGCSFLTIAPTVSQQIFPCTRCEFPFPFTGLDLVLFASLSLSVSLAFSLLSGTGRRPAFRQAASDPTGEANDVAASSGTRRVVLTLSLRRLPWVKPATALHRIL